jgi:hypothetical protein
MKYDSAGKKALHLAQARADRTLADIEAMLKIEDLDATNAALLSERVADELRALPPDARRTTIIQSAVALDELQTLCRSLNDHLDAVGGEIRRVRNHSSVATAYRRGRAAAAGPR